MIETERLIIRKFTLKDAEQSFKMATDPQVMQYIIGERYNSVEQVREMIKKNVFGDYDKYGFGRMAITLKPFDELIGFSGLKYNDDFREVDIGYRLMRKYWGRGIATEASQPFMDYGFRELKLKRIVALAFAENTGSIKVMKKLGMHFEKYMKVDGHEFVCYVKNSLQ
ncbi:MAG: GNAT family N-acetyltransferase [Bacteroidota bacterium]